MSNTRRGSQEDNPGSSWKLEGRMSIIMESCMESWIVTRLNIPVTHSLLPLIRKKLMTVAWSQYTVMVSKGRTKKYN